MPQAAPRKSPIPVPAQPSRTPPDDGPEDMELTIPRRAPQPLNLADSVFDAAERERYQGINSRPSVFAKGTLFRAP
ncbi:MAG: hypothetical protein LBK56_10425 [Gracilibacteraceae bacterium]|jgi:hypothetical protein|nr:hypothetical protein [Gracilibacteraceae bacterium]